MRSPLIPSFLYFTSYFSAALSFSVSVGSSPTQCGSLSVTWTGGQAPFEIMLIPVYDIPRNVSVPSTAFQNNQGSFQVSPVPFAQGAQFLLTMSDATGFGTGGTSNLLTVGAPVGGASCNTSNPSLPFSFSLPSSLQQCSSYVFDGYDGAILPVTIAGLIPGGNAFLLYPPSTAGTSFTWIANVAAGTTVIFTMTDAEGRSGGSSDTQVVSLSNNAGCLNATSPASTVSPVSSVTSATSSSTSSPTHTSSGVSTGTIVGAAVGAVLAVTAVVMLALFYLKRYRYGRPSYGLAPTRNSRRPNSVELDPGTDNFQPPPIYPFPYQTDSVNQLVHPVIPASSSMLTPYQQAPSIHRSETPYARQQHSRTNSNSDSFAALGDVASSSMSSSARRKAVSAGMTSYQPAARFIVHTDAEDRPIENENEVVELPPQYSERRTPVVRPTEERPLSSMTGVSSTSLSYLSGQLAGELPRATPYPPPQ